MRAGARIPPQNAQRFEELVILGKSLNPLPRRPVDQDVPRSSTSSTSGPFFWGEIHVVGLRVKRHRDRPLLTRPAVVARVRRPSFARRSWRRAEDRAMLMYTSGTTAMPRLGHADPMVR